MLGWFFQVLTQGAAIQLLPTPVHKWSLQQVSISNMDLCLVILHYCEHPTTKGFVYPFSLEKWWNKNLDKSRTVPPTCINVKHQSYHLLCSSALTFIFLFTYPHTCYCKIHCCQKYISMVAHCIRCPRLFHSCKVSVCSASQASDKTWDFILDSFLSEEMGILVSQV